MNLKQMIVFSYFFFYGGIILVISAMDTKFKWGYIGALLVLSWLLVLLSDRYEGQRKRILKYVLGIPVALGVVIAIGVWYFSRVPKGSDTQSERLIRLPYEQVRQLRGTASVRSGSFQGEIYN